MDERADGGAIQLIGYDARSFGTDWRSERGEGCWDGFLLRMDLERPLSSDDAVWPSALEPVADRIPDRIGLFSLWESLAELKAFIARHERLMVRPHWIVAVGVVRDALQEAKLPDESSMGFDHAIDHAAPARASESWKFLGFDVSDYFLLSGLSNCGYTSDDQARAAEFAPLLNRYHLFDSLEDAKAFQAWSDERVPEHAPFFVFALYREFEAHHG
jgi:hypothetical protein